jgi:hypothetical protein
MDVVTPGLSSNGQKVGAKARLGKGLSWMTGGVIHAAKLPAPGEWLNRSKSPSKPDFRCSDFALKILHEPSR